MLVIGLSSVLLGGFYGLIDVKGYKKWAFPFVVVGMNFITIYVEVVKEPFKGFSNRFIATLLYNALTKAGEAVGFDLDGLLDKAQERLPKTYAAIRHINIHT